MEESEFRKQFLGEFKPDLSYKAIHKRVQQASSKHIAEELTYLYELSKISIPISKIEELIANCEDKVNPHALENDLLSLIDDIKHG